MTLSNISADARLYLTPTWYVPTPIGLPDGAAARMGNGLIWFQGYELTALDGAVPFSLLHGRGEGRSFDAWI